MKIIELNIGLSTPQGEQLNPIEVLNALTGRGFTLITYRIQESVCKDGIEKCLAVKTEAPSDWQDQIAKLSDKLGQDCIAVVGFIGHSPYDAFAPSLWVEPAAAPTITENGKELSQAEQAENFITWLNECLIPDLIESGSEETAKDFKTLIEFYRNK